MNATIRGLKGLLALGALAGLGLLLHWVTAGSIEAATAQDLTSMASLAIGAVAWIAYCWLVVAVLATVLEQLPGAVGRSASLVAGRITSQGSRALLRSALGVAAVTPLTIGVAHATPDHTLTHQSTTTPSTGTRPWTPAEPHSPLALRGVTPTTATSARPRTAVEPRSSIELRGSTPTAARLRTSVEPQSTVKVRATPTTSHHPTSPQAQPAHPRTTEPPTDSRPWNSLEPQSTVEVTDSTPTAPALPAASGNSVASDDSVASGNSVASSSSVASGHSVASASSVALRGSAYGSVESQSAHSRPSGTPASSRPWNSVEPRSTVELTGGDPTSGTLGAPGASGSGSTESQSAHPRTTGTPAGARPWSSVEPRSSVEITDGTPGDWRATEEPSSVQLGVPATPATPSQANPEPTPQPGNLPSGQPIAKSGSQPGARPGTQPGAKPGSSSSAGKTEQRVQSAERSGAAVGKQTPTGRSAVPEKAAHTTTRRTGQPQTGPTAAGRGRMSGGEVAVPDRPTSGAPTRYTHLQSGQLVRTASHVVKAGDSLWSIAAAELGPNATAEAIAGRWPQWYAANRQLIGPNPNLIFPGQVLNPPAPSHPVPPTHQEK